MSSGPVHALILSKGDNVGKRESTSLTAIIHPEHAELIQPKKNLQAQFAIDNVTINQLHGSSTPDEAPRTHWP
ncbi:unnamed protein product [Coregonus sp. 'balchen']|nr:unnamed protein product [Coregonus sp. 'balchen']